MNHSGSQDPGNDSILMRTLVWWVESNISATTSPEGSRPCGHISRMEGGIWKLAFALQRGPGKRQKHFVPVDPMGTRTDRYPLNRLGPGVWDIARPVHVEKQFQGFVTVCGVPDPAPWEVGYIPPVLAPPKPGDVVIKTKEPSEQDLGELAGAWVKKIVDSCPYAMTGYAVVLGRPNTTIFMSAAANPKAHAEFRAAIVKHLAKPVPAAGEPS